MSEINQQIAKAAHDNEAVKIDFAGVQWWFETGETAIHSQNLPEIQKLNYLLSCLKEVALRVVQGYELTSEDYWFVRELLIGKFKDLSIIKGAV